jgi:hypothetical protein
MITRYQTMKKNDIAYEEIEVFGIDLKTEKTTLLNIEKMIDAF